MKKIKTLFIREFENHRIKSISQEAEESCKWVLDSEGKAFIKRDGTACIVIDGKLYKRYDAKHGKQAPVGAIPCQEADSITGHHPHWLAVCEDKPEDRIFTQTWKELGEPLADGTYELCGEKVNCNYEKLIGHKFIKHDSEPVDVERTFGGIKKWLENNEYEGLVFHRENGDMCKIKRSDFGLTWGRR